MECIVTLKELELQKDQALHQYYTTLQALRGLEEQVQAMHNLLTEDEKDVSATMEAYLREKIRLGKDFEGKRQISEAGQTTQYVPPSGSAAASPDEPQGGVCVAPKSGTVFGSLV